MQFIIPVLFCTLLVSGIRSEADPLTGRKEGHYEYLQSFHHGGQHHPSVGSGSEVGNAGEANSGVAHAGVSPQIQDQNTAVVHDQIPHQTVGQVGGHQGQIPVVQPGIPPFVQKVEAPHYFGRAIGSPYPYLYGKTYASPYYAPYQQAASPYSGGYYHSAYPYHYSAGPYSASPYSAAVTPYSSPVYSGGPGGYSGYSGYPGGVSNYGYVPPSYYPGYTPYYQQSSEVQQSPSKQ